MRENGFAVKTEEVKDSLSIKQKLNVPAELYSCHTAVVDGYIIEGHVPAAEVNRLLAERPDIAGLAVPGMPPGSPGMDQDGVEPVPFDVLAFTDGGTTSVFASITP